MKKEVTILTGEPTIEVIAEMCLNWEGVTEMGNWVQSHRPECLPEEWKGDILFDAPKLFPHDCRRPSSGGHGDSRISDNEMLVELAGRKCYDSFGLKAGRKSNAEYIAHTQEMDPPHASILYHAKMSFFFAGISRRVSHELIRNYVGADRSEEGAPSQESTRFTHHYGFFICPPRYLAQEDTICRSVFESAMESAYDYYLAAVEADVRLFAREHGGAEPKGTDRKRIYEAASAFLPHQAETSFIWTTNPAAIAKLVKERAGEAADLEMQRFAKKLRRICVERWPNLFPQPHMQEPQ
jgi:thymidylate synthase (FAD)